MLPSATDRKNVKNGVVFIFLFFLYFFLECPKYKKNHRFWRQKLKILTSDLFTVCFLLIVSLYFGLQKKYIL